MKKMRSFLWGSALGAAAVWMTTTPKGKAFCVRATEHGKRVADLAEAYIKKNDTARGAVLEVEDALKRAYDEYITGTPIEKGMRKAVKRISTAVTHKKKRGRKK
jgi:hypothetical protein